MPEMGRLAMPRRALGNRFQYQDLVAPAGIQPTVRPREAFSIGAKGFTARRFDTRQVLKMVRNTIDAG